MTKVTGTARLMLSSPAISRSVSMPSLKPKLLASRITGSVLATISVFASSFAACILSTSGWLSPCRLRVLSATTSTVSPGCSAAISAGSILALRVASL